VATLVKTTCCRPNTRTSHCRRSKRLDGGRNCCAGCAADDLDLAATRGPPGAATTKSHRPLSRRNHNVSFSPHLTVCRASAEPALLDAAAAYIRECRLLPLKVAKAYVKIRTCSKKSQLFPFLCELAHTRAGTNRIRVEYRGHGRVPRRVYRTASLRRSGLRSAACFLRSWPLRPPWPARVEVEKSGHAGRLLENFNRFAGR